MIVVYRMIWGEVDGKCTFVQAMVISFIGATVLQEVVLTVAEVVVRNGYI